MERRLPAVKNIKFSLSLAVIFAVCGIFAGAGVFAQTPSVIEHIRFPVWAEVDAYPGTEAAAQDSSAEEFDYPIARVKEIVPFLMEGLVYGWNFVYVPSDKTRGIEEYMEVTPVRSDAVVPALRQAQEPQVEGRNLSSFDIKYSSVWIENSRFNCWVDYTRTDYEVQTYYLWSSIQNPTIQGRGYGDLSKGFDGIKEAAQEALKNAVREHYRSQLKNKPREITGRVLVRKIPLIGIDSGRYVIKLDFFLECGTILEYKQF